MHPSHTVSAQGVALSWRAPCALFLFGILMLYGTGFSHLPAVHNAAHDSRHSFALPCH